MKEVEPRRTRRFVVAEPEGPTAGNRRGDGSTSREAGTTGVVSLLGADLSSRKHRDGGRLLKLEPAAERLHRGVQTFADRLKDARRPRPLQERRGAAAARRRGRFSVCPNEAQLTHAHLVCIGARFGRLNRGSQKRALHRAQFKREPSFDLLPRPPRGDALTDLSAQHHSVRKHQPKSRMRDSRTSGSVRSLERPIGRSRCA